MLFLLLPTLNSLTFYVFDASKRTSGYFSENDIHVYILCLHCRYPVSIWPTLWRLQMSLKKRTLTLPIRKYIRIFWRRLKHRRVRKRRQLKALNGIKYILIAGYVHVCVKKLFYLLAVYIHCTCIYDKTNANETQYSSVI